MQPDDLRVFLWFCLTVDVVMVHDYFNDSTTSIDSQLHLLEQPVDAAHTLGNYAQWFYVNFFV